MDTFTFSELPYDLKLETLSQIDYPTLKVMCMTNREIRGDLSE